MAVAFGKFDLLPSYDLVRPVFLLFTNALSENNQAISTQKLSQYYMARDALELTLEDEDGHQVATGHIHIVDWGSESETDLEIEVHVTDPQFWK
jgi:hypothetical protein